ncbi:hypothetical protein ABH908_000443 [Pseudomonas frederiksbergensis]|uniref:hypothetical protein n=1 Tax=Pseudomonas TaxID=286 RepID=UPI003D1DA0C7
MSQLLDVHKQRFAFIDIRPAIQAACNAGFNASQHDTPPAEICEDPLLLMWFETGQRAKSYIDHVKS